MVLIGLRNFLYVTLTLGRKQKQNSPQYVLDNLVGNGGNLDKNVKHPRKYFLKQIFYSIKFPKIDGRFH